MIPADFAPHLGTIVGTARPSSDDALTSLKQLIREIHRRSLWQVLGIYAVGGWVVFEVVQTATEGLGLPQWFPQLAALLLLVGLPIVMATAFVQEGIAPHNSPGDLRSAPSERAGPPGDQPPGLRSVLTWRHAILGGTAVFALWGLVAAGWLVFGGPRTPENAPPGIRSLAVLPLENNMGDPDQDYFVDGMTELLTAELAKVGGILVTSRTSTAQYKDSPKTAAQIAAELGVDALIEGSILRGTESVRVTVQLIEGATDRHLWAESYEGRLEDAVALQGRIATAIVREIEIVLTPDEQALLASVGPVDPVAQDAFLRGEVYLDRVRREEGGGGEAAELAVESYRRAIGLAPDWALAHAALAEAHHWIASSRPGGRDAEHCELSRVASERALGLDEREPRAHLARGFDLYRCDWDFGEAEPEYRRAFELSPNASRWGLGLMYLHMGRYDEAIASYRHDLERSPAWLILRVQFGFALHCAGRDEEAEQQLREAIALGYLQPIAYRVLGMALLELGRTEDAIRTVEQGRELSQGTLQGFLAYAYARSGDLARAERLLDEAEAAGEEVWPFVYTALGQKDRALALYQDAFERRSTAFLRIHCDPYVEELRTDPQIQRMMVEAFGG